MINKYSFFFRKKRIKICCKFKRFFFSRSYILPWPPRTATGMDGTLPHCQLKEEQEEQKVEPEVFDLAGDDGEKKAKTVPPLLRPTMKNKRPNKTPKSSEKSLSPKKSPKKVCTRRDLQNQKKLAKEIKGRKKQTKKGQMLRGKKRERALAAPVASTPKRVGLEELQEGLRHCTQPDCSSSNNQARKSHAKAVMKCPDIAVELEHLCSTSEYDSDDDLHEEPRAENDEEAQEMEV